MNNSSSAGRFQLASLPLGFHRKRFEAKGVGFEAYIWRGGPGPILLINGATHGDEYEGPSVLHEWVREWRPSKLTGSVIMVPVLNEGAFFAGSRCHPVDGGNLARAFPGSRTGTETTRLAHLFATQLIALCTHYVDLHSGGVSYELYPWVGYMKRPDATNLVQSLMASCFEDFWCWISPFLPGRTLSAAFEQDKPAIYVECRGTGGVTARDVRHVNRGLRTLLRTLAFIPGRSRVAKKQRVRITSDPNEAHLQLHHPAPLAGLFYTAVEAGQIVNRGAVIGEVFALDGQKHRKVRAEQSGRIVSVRNKRSVERGDALFTIVPAR